MGTGSSSRGWVTFLGHGSVSDVQNSDGQNSDSSKADDQILAGVFTAVQIMAVQKWKCEKKDYTIKIK